MEPSKPKNNDKIAPFIAGTLAGLVFGILFAPDKGSVTRNKIVSGTKDMAEDVKRKMKEKIKALRDEADKLEKLADSELEDDNDLI
jgi:gas vesicle protein